MSRRIEHCNLKTLEFGTFEHNSVDLNGIMEFGVWSHVGIQQVKHRHRDYTCSHVNHIQ